VREARALLARVAVPVGAVRLAGPPQGAALIENRFPGLATTALPDVHAYWRAPGPPRRVLAFIEAYTPHPTKGLAGSGGYRGGPTFFSSAFEFAPLPGVIDARWLVVKVIGLRDGTTAVRVDAEVVWVIPRPVSERIPGNVREIDITSGPPGRAPEVSVTVTAAATVTKIVSLINSLPTLQPYAPPHCPSFSADTPVVTLTFRATPVGQVVAQVTQLASPAVTTSCDPMSLTLFAKRQTPLLDGGAAIRTIQRLLGVRLAPAH
jgi:hypothetical protein